MLLTPDPNKYFIDKERVTETVMLSSQLFCILWAKLDTPASH
jgi:hypothetical protein